MNVLIVSTEPTPYKTDLYNALNSNFDNMLVYYSSEKSWCWDAGHNYLEFPRRSYSYFIASSKNFIRQIFSAFKLIFVFLFFKPDKVLICTYNRLPFITAIMLSWIKRIPFVVWDDHFNTGFTVMKGFLPNMLRGWMRRFIFKYSQRVLVCGSFGRMTAIQVGCPETKIVNFPYVVDYIRMHKEANLVNQLIDCKAPIILFSGRFIERKGFPILIEALKYLKDYYYFTLVVEGDGPCKSKYINLVNSAGLAKRVFFTGFLQMTNHSKIISEADIIVVPSLSDPWGIVVQEGLGFGKIVIASNAVGSAIDFIDHGVNGFIFKTGDILDLTEKLNYILNNISKLHFIKKNAVASASQINPDINAAILSKIFFD